MTPVRQHRPYWVKTSGRARASRKSERWVCGKVDSPAGNEGEICAAKIKVFSNPRMLRKLPSVNHPDAYAHYRAQCRRAQCRDSQEHQVQRVEAK